MKKLLLPLIISTYLLACDSNKTGSELAESKDKPCKCQCDSLTTSERAAFTQIPETTMVNMWQRYKELSHDIKVNILQTITTDACLLRKLSKDQISVRFIVGAYLAGPKKDSVAIILRLKGKDSTKVYYDMASVHAIMAQPYAAKGFCPLPENCKPTED